MTHPLFELVTTSAGVISIRNRDLGEIMHNPVGPWVEANALYIDQANLEQRLAQSASEDLVLFDVGLGAAANALAALHCVKKSAHSGRKLHLISFERDLDLLRFALHHAGVFAHFHGYTEVLQTILAQGYWEGPGVKWELRHGDFLQMVARESVQPHVIFYDPYSPKVNCEMWSVDGFSLLRKICRTENQGGTLLLTYSQATPIRVALLRAGFYVGHGRPTGRKEETTQAATVLGDLPQPLGPVWLERWRKSHAKHPAGWAPEQCTLLDDFVLRHEQFRR